MTKVTRDDDSKDIYTVPVEQCNIQTSVEESKHEEKLKNAIIVTGEYTSNKESRKIPEKKRMRLYIFPGAPTLFYQQSNQNSCILTSLASSFFLSFFWSGLRGPKAY